MIEQERLAEVAALHLERKRKAEEVAALDRKIELILFPESGEKRKKQTRSGQEWEIKLRSSHERVAKERRALAGKI